MSTACGYPPEWRRSVASRLLLVLVGALSVMPSACGRPGPVPVSGGSAQGEPPLICEVTVSAEPAATHPDSPIRVRLVQTRLDYSAAPGHFLGPEKQAECRTPISRGAIAPNNHCSAESFVPGCRGEGDNSLWVIVQGFPDFALPAELSVCQFAAHSIPEPEDFILELMDVSDKRLAPVRPSPEVRISSIDCVANTPDASTTTTTTMPACAPGECEEGGAYTVDLHVNEDYLLGALQFDLDYSCAGGAIPGEGAGASCRTEPGLNVFVSMNNQQRDDTDCATDSGPGMVSAALISLPGFPTGGRIMTCDFVADSAAPTADDFSIRTVDAATPGSVAVDPLPVVTIGAIRPAGVR